MSKTLICRFVLVLIVLIVTCNISTCIQFSRLTTGVVFSPYIKKSENGEFPSRRNYSLDEVKTMMKVISTRFSKVVTRSVGAENVMFVEGLTYNQSNAEVLSAEAAALVNRENGTKKLTLIIGLWQSELPERMNTEIKLGLECARRANSIFQGTVEGFIFAQDDIHSNEVRAKQALLEMTSLRNQTDLKIGTLQQCSGLSIDEIPEDDVPLIRRQIISASDFVICMGAPASPLPSGGSKFITVRQDFLRFRREFQSINPKIEVMGETGLAYRGNQSWETVENSKNHWMEADKWGAKSNFSIWLREAIDNPWKEWGAHRGWWRLKENGMADKIEGYAENVEEPPNEEELADEKPDTGTGAWVYIVLAIAVGAIIVILVAVGLLYARVQKLQGALSTQDIKEFLYGLSNEAQQQDGDALIQFALTFPYDKSYEIPKDKLKIRKEELLGSGQFGCVYKALIGIGDKEDIEVALKMAKKHCPKSALLGLLSEIKTLIYLGKHENLASIRGAYTAQLSKGVVYVATELCPNGSLEDYLRKNPFHGNYVSGTNGNHDKLDTTARPRPSEYTLLDMVRWSHEIACGMEYIVLKQVIHADLATRNVLLDHNKTAKISDFGLSRRLYDYTNYVKTQQEPLPWRWMAIESLKRLEFSEKSDVWSYGVTLWEIFALGDVPYPGLSWTPEFVDFLVNGLRMKSPLHATSEIYNIMVSCWNMEPEGRPSFEELKLSIAHALETGGSEDHEKCEEPTLLQ